MAPERFKRDGVADARADIYALACVLLQALTCQPPFPADAIEKIAVAHMFEPPPRPSELLGGVPQAMDNVIATGMAKDPDQRYATTKDLARGARAALTTPSPREATPPQIIANATTASSTGGSEALSVDATADHSATTTSGGSVIPSTEAAKATEMDNSPSHDMPPHVADPHTTEAPTQKLPPPGIGNTPTQLAPLPASSDRNRAVPSTHAAPAHAGVPLFQRLSRRSMIVLSVVAIVFVTAIGLIASVVGSKSSGDRTASPTSTTESTRMSTTTTSAVDPASHLLAIVPGNLGCPADATNVPEGAVAQVSCSPSVLGGGVTEYELFPDQVTLDRNFNNPPFPRASEVLRPSPGRGQSPQHWHRAASPQQTDGEISCTIITFPSGFRYPIVKWTIDSELVLGIPEGPEAGASDRSTNGGRPGTSSTR